MTTKTWRDYSTGIAWGTVALFIVVIIIDVALMGAIYTESISLIAGMLIQTVVLYLGFTVVHEAGHGNIAHDVSWMKPVERFMGWALTTFFFILPFGLFAKIHDYHHAFTNDPDRDPDHWVSGDTWKDASLRALVLPLNYLVLMATRFRKDPVIGSTLTSTLIYFAATSSMIIGILAAGYWQELLIVGIIPLFLSSYVLGMLFDWIPHMPTRQQGRFQNTRSYLFPGLKFLTLGQNYHHIHHLYPRVSWYHYQRVFNLIRPMLEKNNAPIEVLFSKTQPGLGQSLNALQPSSLEGFHKLTLDVERIQKLTDNSVAISFAALQGKTIDFKAGQYVTVTKLIAGQAITRCYSICESPNENKLTIGVKRIEGGVLSSFLNNELAVGDELTVAGPFGEFVYNQPVIKDDTSLILIAAGSGITPILSIAKTALQDDAKTAFKKVQLIYINPHSDDVMFYQQLAELQAEYPERFQLTHQFTRHSSGGLQEHSNYLTEETLRQLLDTHPNPLNSQYYICGPDGLKNTVNTTLSNLGVKSEQIFTEEFSQLKVEPKGIRHPVNIVLPNGESHELEIAENQTVLQAAQQSGLHIPHACGIGQCGCCMMKIEQGSVQLTSDDAPGLLAKEQASGLTLACLCQPKSALSLTCAAG